MKRIVAILMVILLIAPSAMAAPQVTAANSIDLSNLTYEELVALKDRINLAMWQLDEWQEVTVPQGVWKVGEDIPAGHWTIKTDAAMANITICDALNESGKNADIWESKVYYSETVHSATYTFFDAESDRLEIDFELAKGMYVIIDYGSAVFTPYAGKPSLGFK